MESLNDAPRIYPYRPLAASSQRYTGVIDNSRESISHRRFCSSIEHGASALRRGSSRLQEDPGSIGIPQRRRLVCISSGTEWHLWQVWTPSKRGQAESIHRSRGVESLPNNPQE